MARLTKVDKAIKILKDQDYIALQHIYLYRTLTITQLMHSVYHLRDNQTRRRNAIIKRLLDLDLIQLTDFKSKEHAVNLTNTGISIVRQTKDIPQEIFDDNLKTVKRGYYTAGELKMKKNLFNHQLTKNEFMLKFQKLISDPKFKAEMDKLKINLKYSYFDEKYLTTYIMMRPDSVLHIGDTDFFIEEDMATESASQLEDKWRHYREFMQTSEFNMKENKIVVLFLTDNIVKAKSLKRRKDLVRNTAMKIIGDTFTNYFDMIIGSQDEIIQIMPQLIENAYGMNLPMLKVYSFLHKKGWTISETNRLQKQLNYENYAAYIRKVDASGTLIKKDFRNQEFVLDDYTLRPVAVEHRMSWLKHNDLLFSHLFNRPLQYIVFVKDGEEKQIYYDLKNSNSEFQANLFFTTFKRFKSLPLKDALFQFDQTGRLYHFYDDELIKRVYE